MSTHVCFERHLDLGQLHEECASMASEDAAATWLRSRSQEAELQAMRDSSGLSVSERLPREAWSGEALSEHSAAAARASPGPNSEMRRALKSVRWAHAQQKLAAREYREAVRLRPRNATAKQRLKSSLLVLRALQASIDAPRRKPLGRFLAHYNLSIRYWDLGKAKQALLEAELACEELSKFGLPVGCAEHNLLVIERVQADYRSEERRLVEATQKAPQAVKPGYDLAMVYFDKRMLIRAEAQLRWVREQTRAASALHVVERDRQRLLQASQTSSHMELPVQLATDTKKAQRLCGLLDGFEDDLSFLAGLRALWCVEEETGKTDQLQATGVRDGARRQLLPCLHRRFSQDCSACDAWWNDLCSRPDVDLHAMPGSSSDSVGSSAKKRR